MNIIDDKYIIENIKLGTGGFAEVFLGTDLRTNRKLAIKKVSLNQKNLREEQTLKKLQFEIEIMQKLKHPNVVEYYDVVKTNTDWYIMMEYCNAGTLDNVIKYNEQMNKSKSIVFNREANTYYYMNQLKDALKYIRQTGHVHRDIKPMNILLTRIMSTGISNNSSLDNLGSIFTADEQLMANIDKTNFDHSQNIILKLADFG